MFVGREKELQYLKDNYSKDASNIIILYGHRGVGKTSLVRRFAEGKCVAYLTCRDCSEKEQLFIWNEEFNFGINEADLSYEILFNHVSYEGEGKKLLIIDEFQAAVKNSDDFLGMLMRYVKEMDEKVMVLLVCSSICYVENSFVDKVGALALNISGYYKVSELTFADLVSYFSGYDIFSCVKLYSIFGGMPSYWTKISPKLSVKDNIERCILHPDSVLHNEGLNIVSQELRELNVYSTILNCLANGKNKLNELHVHTGYSRAKISVYIKNLMERELVTKVFSFDNASTANSKKGVYRIQNRFLQFYFRFMYNKLSLLTVYGPKKFYETCVEPYIDAYYQENLRFVAYEYMDISNQMGLLPFKATKIGEWVGKNGSIDVILQNDDWDTICCYCNWNKEVITKDDFDNFASIADDARIHPDYFYIISKGAFSDELLEYQKVDSRLHLIDLKSF